MKKLFSILMCVVVCVSLLASCEGKCSHRWDEGVEIEGGADGCVMEYTCRRCGEKHSEVITSNSPEEEESDAEYGQFTEYENLVTKDEFQKQYKEAHKNLQPDYTKDFVYLYSNDYTEITESGEDKSVTNERTEYDADSQIVRYNHEFKTNDEDAAADESYFWEYREENGAILFYDSRTEETKSHQLGFDEFWEFAHSHVPLVLFPNPNKLFDDSTYYIDFDKDGNKVFTLYSSDESGYSLRQVIFTGAEMIYRTKSYTKELDYEDITVDIYRVYNAEVSLTSTAEIGKGN